MLPVFVFGHYLSTRDSACSRGAIAHRPTNASKRALEAMRVGLGTHIVSRPFQGCREAPKCVLVGGGDSSVGFESHGDETRSAVVMKLDMHRTL